MRFLKQNTAVIITVGPFFDKTDGVVLETGLTITNERISFTVDLDNGSAPTLVLDNVTGATSGTANDLNYITNCDAALMQLELAAANVNYVGRAFLTITDAANHCPVFHEFMILPANVYDSLMGTDALQVHANEITNGLITANAIASDAIAAAKIATGAITAAKFAAGAIDAAAIANAAIDFATFAADCKTGSGLKANVESITANAITAAAVADAAIDFATFAADCKTGSGLKANVESISANAITATAINADAITEAKIADNALANEHFANGALTSTEITSAAGCVVASIANNAITANAINADAFTAAKFHADVSAEIADAVWDEVIDTGAHDTATFAGKRLLDAGGAGTPPTVGEIADAVWEEAIADHTTSSTFGGKNQKVVPSETLNDYKATGFSTHSAADVKTAVEAAGSHLTLILEDTGELQTNQGAWATAVGFSTHSAADVKTAIEAGGSSIAQILADTGELQTDLVNGGRLDLLVDAIKAKTDLIPAAPAATGDIPSAASIADAVWDEVATGHTDAGKAGAQVWTDIDAIAIDVAGLDGDAMRGTDSAALASVLGAAVGASISADIAAVKAETALIVEDTGTTLQAEVDAIQAAVITNAAGADVAADIIALKAVADLTEDILRNKMEVTDANGNVVLYEDDGSTPKFSVAACLTDDSTTTTRKRLA